MKRYLADHDMIDGMHRSGRPTNILQLVVWLLILTFESKKWEITRWILATMMTPLFSCSIDGSLGALQNSERRRGCATGRVTK